MKRFAYWFVVVALGLAMGIPMFMLFVLPYIVYIGSIFIPR